MRVSYSLVMKGIVLVLPLVEYFYFWLKERRAEKRDIPPDYELSQHVELPEGFSKNNRREKTD